MKQNFMIKFIKIAKTSLVFYYFSNLKFCSNQDQKTQTNILKFQSNL